MKKIRTPHILLLIVVISQFALTTFTSVSNISFNVTQAILISQGSILVPFAIYCLMLRKNPFKVIRFKKIKPLSIFMAILVAIFSYPVVIFLNMVSMLFVENAVAEIIPEVLQQGIVSGLFLMAFLPAVVEETIFRGTLYNTYSKYNPVAGVFLSAVLFGLMHMNFNQVPYAIYMGIIAALLLEACDTILAPMILHFTMNGTSLVLSFLTEGLQGEETLTQSTNMKEALIESFKLSMQEMNPMITDAQMDAMVPFALIGMIGMFAIVAMIALAFVLIFVYIAFSANHRKPKEIFKKPEALQKQRMIDIWVIAFMLYALYECIRSL